MTTVKDLEELLYVENLHAEHFRDWEKRGTHPLAKAVFRLVADKEEDHVGWVHLLLEIAKAKEAGRDLGVTRGDLEYWVEDEGSEAQSYERFLRHAEEPWVRAVVRQMAEDEASNARLLETLLKSTA